MKLSKIVEHLIDDCQKNIEETEDKEYIISNYEAIKELEKVKTVKELLKVFDEDYILPHFELNSIKEIEED
ncbi:MAG: hypothetical protein ACE5K4_12490 [Candidatus Hydrothermarchaeota archaeon]